MVVNAIEVTDVSMIYNMSRERLDTIKEYALKLFKRQLWFEAFTALQDVTFSVEKGDTFGLLGLNGAGKSTLLKIISGIMKPTKGCVKTIGTICPLVELGAGFDLELTARENIYLNGSVLGFSKRFLKEKFDDIVDFSEMHEFLDTPMKNYSSGMVARIAFSIATMTNPDILILDEVLGVGDFKFMEKCEHRIGEIMNSGATVIIVSHSIDQIKRLCKHAILLERGVVKAIGNTEDVCKIYER